MTGPRPETLDDLIATWRRRAEDRQHTARKFGLDTVEGRIMQVDAAAIDQCTNELLHVLTAEGWHTPA